MLLREWELESPSPGGGSAESLREIVEAREEPVGDPIPRDRAGEPRGPSRPPGETVPQGDRPRGEQTARHQRTDRGVSGPSGGTTDEVSRPQHVEDQSVALHVDRLHQERTPTDHPRIRVRLTLADDLPSGMHIEQQGEWVAGHPHTHHSFARVTLSTVADTQPERTR